MNDSIAIPVIFFTTIMLIKFRMVHYMIAYNYLRVFCIFSTTSVEYLFEDKCFLSDPLSEKKAVMSYVLIPQFFDTAE